MTLTRLGLILATGGGLAYSQISPPPGAEFEVASIKLNPDCDNRPRNVAIPSPGRLTLECVTLYSAIQSAYGIFASGVSADLKVIEIVGGPGWSNAERYDITAKANGEPSQAQMRGPMLQALLEGTVQAQASPRSEGSPNLCAHTVKERH